MSMRFIQKLFTLAIFSTIAASVAVAQPGPGRGGFGGGRGPTAPAGPPAPVPPQVAIARPTPAEVEKLNADLKAYIAKSPDKELLQKWESLLKIQTAPRQCLHPSRPDRRAHHRAPQWVRRDRHQQRF